MRVPGTISTTGTLESLCHSFMHKNESSELYHYLRAGLPVITDSGFPNDYVVRDTGCGSVVQSGNMRALADAVLSAGRTNRDRDFAIRYIPDNQTWDKRVAGYDQVLRRGLRQKCSQLSTVTA